MVDIPKERRQPVHYFKRRKYEPIQYELESTHNFRREKSCPSQNQDYMAELIMKIGDKIKILRKFDTNEDGYCKKTDVYWNTEMDKLIDTIQTIVSFNDSKDEKWFGFPYIIHNGDRWLLTPHVIELINEEPPTPKFPIKIGDEILYLPKAIIDLL